MNIDINMNLNMEMNININLNMNKKVINLCFPYTLPISPTLSPPIIIVYQCLMMTAKPDVHPISNLVLKSLVFVFVISSRETIKIVFNNECFMSITFSAPLWPIS